MPSIPVSKQKSWEGKCESKKDTYSAKIRHKLVELRADVAAHRKKSIFIFDIDRKNS